MRGVLMIGSPTHLLGSNSRRSACGVSNPKGAAQNTKPVDCFRCRRTKRYKARRVYEAKNVQEVTP
jgi:hypothetical protein